MSKTFKPKPFNPKYDDKYVNEQKARFILEQAKERLKNTFDSSDSLDRKTLTFFSLLSTLTTALLGFVSTQYKPGSSIECQKWFVIAPAFVLALIFGFLTWMLTKNLRPVDYDTAGKAPQFIINDKVLQCDYDLLLMEEAIDYQNRIDKNDYTNQEKANRINNSLLGISIAFIIAVVVMIGFIYLSLDGKCHFQ